MYTHRGRSRTIKHNIQIAVVLSFIAGIVNVSGFLFFKQLTTHVTGHFSLFVYNISDLNLWTAFVYLFYIFSFLFGSFSSSFLIIKFKKNKNINALLLPTLIESIILISIGVLSNFIEMRSSNLIICLLLYAMGLQNSFVTKVSNSIVRTTHLTGLITDLGIDLSQTFFPKIYPNQKKLKTKIRLRLSIISFFFLGGIIGAFLYTKLNFKLNTLIFGALILLISLIYNKRVYKK